MTTSTAIHVTMTIIWASIIPTPTYMSTTRATKTPSPVFPPRKQVVSPTTSPKVPIPHPTTSPKAVFPHPTTSPKAVFPHPTTATKATISHPTTTTKATISHPTTATRSPPPTTPASIKTVQPSSILPKARSTTQRHLSHLYGHMLISSLQQFNQVSCIFPVLLREKGV
jgi:hypothetical protein